MSAITPTQKYRGEFAGANRILNFSCVPGSASDTVDLTLMGVNSVVGIFGAHVSAGQDANLMTAHLTVSTTTLTIATLGADGGAATDWTGAVVYVTLIVT